MNNKGKKQGRMQAAAIMMAGIIAFTGSNPSWLGGNSIALGDDTIEMLGDEAIEGSGSEEAPSVNEETPSAGEEAPIEDTGEQTNQDTLDAGEEQNPSRQEDVIDDLLIEDEGDMLVVEDGPSLDDIQAQHKAAEEEARQRESETETETETEDPDLAQAGPVLEPADPENIEEYLQELTKEENSSIGSNGELINARYIRLVMEEYGCKVSGQSFHEGFLNEDGVDAPGVNVIAERGVDSQENQTDDILIICTHYDSKTHPEEDDPYANDKSGAAVLLEMARILSFQETDTDICFLFLSGEEDGLYGSSHFVSVLKDTIKKRIVGVIDVERVGYSTDAPYVIETYDGEGNRIGELVRAEMDIEPGDITENLQLEDDVLEGDAFDSLYEEETEEGAEAETEKPIREWDYVKGSGGSQKSFADAELDAVTIRQNIPIREEAAEESTEEGEATGSESAQGEEGDATGVEGELSEGEATGTEGEISDGEAVQGDVSDNSDIESASGDVSPIIDGVSEDGDALQQEVTIDIEKLQKLTDSLSMVVARIMSPDTESMM